MSKKEQIFMKMNRIHFLYTCLERRLNMLNISDINISYSNKHIFKNAYVKFYNGNIHAVIGASGSGKTTLIKVLNGLLKEYDGDVQIDQQAIGIHSKKIISYLPDEPYFENWMTTSDALNLFVDMYDDFDLNKALSLMERMDIEKKVKIKELSKGMKEKFQLILVMSRKAKIYILDEPLGGIDPAARELILDTILNNYAEDALVLLSTHLIADIEKIFDEVIFIKNGEIILH